jgi:D,D-heptose 1,7-bisphosphate phosphatase
MHQRAVFLDKDGTLIEDVPYNADPDRIRLSAGCVAGLRSLCAAGYRLVVVSNQSGVARGYFPEAALEAVAQRLRLLLGEIGVPLMGFYYCPHHPEGQIAAYARPCSCRKPQPGLLLQAAAVHHLTLADSWLIGDILDDVEAGHRAGCRTVLLDNGHETEWVLNRDRQPHHRAATIDEAAQIILHGAGGGP